MLQSEKEEDGRRGGLVVKDRSLIVLSRQRFSCGVVFQHVLTRGVQCSRGELEYERLNDSTTAGQVRVIHRWVVGSVHASRHAYR